MFFYHYSVKHLESTVNAALLLLSRLIGKLLKSSTHALKAIVSLTLHTAKQLWDYTSFAGIQDQQVTSLISRRNEILYQCLNEWVKKFYSSSFGDATLKEANNEINVSSCSLSCLHLFLMPVTIP